MKGNLKRLKGDVGEDKMAVENFRERRENGYRKLQRTKSSRRNEKEIFFLFLFSSDLNELKLEKVANEGKIKIG